MGIIAGIGLPQKTLKKIEVVELPDTGQVNTEYWVDNGSTYAVYVYRQNDWVLIAEPTKANSQGSNLISPEIDASIRKHIIGKSTIIDGLTISNNTLSKGTCILCGYSGTLTGEKELFTSTDKYVYGKFVIHFDDRIDGFDIETTTTAKSGDNINPTSIETDGTYYLLLYTYTNGAYVVNSALDIGHNYPAKAYESDEATDLISGGTIDTTATTETATVNAHTTQPLRVANTEYVHNQIEKEIAYDTITIPISATAGSGSTSTSFFSAELNIKRKAKYVYGFSLTNVSGMISTTSIPSNTIIGTVPLEFRPSTNSFAVISLIGTSSATYPTVDIRDDLLLTITSTGNILMRKQLIGAYETFTSGEVVIGYETN